ncbi:chaperone NapD [Cribrihabitans sp. XS_ASV171]
MSEERWHVSSAVITIAEGERDRVRRLIETLEGVELHGGDATRLIVTIEGTSTGQLGDRLTEINLMPGVLAANMVFEHAEETEEPPCHST